MGKIIGGFRVLMLIVGIMNTNSELEIWDMRIVSRDVENES
jgi:hypothetical protein